METRYVRLKQVQAELSGDWREASRLGEGKSVFQVGLEPLQRHIGLKTDSRASWLDEPVETCWSPRQGGEVRQRRGFCRGSAWGWVGAGGFNYLLQSCQGYVIVITLLGSEGGLDRWTKEGNELDQRQETQTNICLLLVTGYVLVVPTMKLIPSQPKQADNSESLRWASIKFTVFRSLTTWKRKLTIKQLYTNKKILIGKNRQTTSFETSHHSRRYREIILITGYTGLKMLTTAVSKAPFINSFR